MSIAIHTKCHPQKRERARAEKTSGQRNVSLIAKETCDRWVSHIKRKIVEVDWEWNKFYESGSHFCFFRVWSYIYFYREEDLREHITVQRIMEREFQLTWKNHVVELIRERLTQNSSTKVRGLSTWVEFTPVLHRGADIFPLKTTVKDTLLNFRIVSRSFNNMEW